MVVGYIRVSTTKQDTENQKGEIARWAEYNNTPIDRYVAETVTSKSKEREVFNLVDELCDGDILIVTELSRLARSVKELLHITETLVAKNVRIVFKKEGLDIHNDNPTGKLMLSILASIAEFERSMIGMRTKEAIQTKRDAGVVIGRVAGSKNKEHKLMGKEKKVQEYLDKGMSKSDIAKVLGVGRVTLYRFLENI